VTLCRWIASQGVRSRVSSSIKKRNYISHFGFPGHFVPPCADAIPPAWGPRHPARLLRPRMPPVAPRGISA
jgi:hypothetical protein